jgi:hypothetical protein
MEAQTMNAATEMMHSITISEEERAEITRLLEQVLGETRVEVHRTHTPEYRQRVMAQETLLRALLDKFQGIRTHE